MTSAVQKVQLPSPQARHNTIQQPNQKLGHQLNSDSPIHSHHVLPLRRRPSATHISREDCSGRSRDRHGLRHVQPVHSSFPNPSPSILLLTHRHVVWCPLAPRNAYQTTTASRTSTRASPSVSTAASPNSSRSTSRCRRRCSRRAPPGQAAEVGADSWACKEQGVDDCGAKRVEGTLMELV